MSKSTLPGIILIILGIAILVAGLIWLAIKGSKSTSKSGPYACIGIGLVLLIVGIIVFVILKTKSKDTKIEVKNE